jgi:hypothetical protein
MFRSDPEAWKFDAMPRYFFHFVWSDVAVRDSKGVELEDLEAAYRHAIGLVRQVRVRFSDSDDDWLVEISNETGEKPLVVLPSIVPRPHTKRAHLASDAER